LIAVRRHLSSAAAPLPPPPSTLLRPRALVADRRHLSSATAPLSPPSSRLLRPTRLDSRSAPSFLGCRTSAAAAVAFVAPPRLDRR
jgi:hypothetical protein